MTAGHWRPVHQHSDCFLQAPGEGSPAQNAYDWWEQCGIGPGRWAPHVARVAVYRALAIHAAALCHAAGAARLHTLEHATLSGLVLTAGLWQNCRAHHLCDGHIVNRLLEHATLGSLVLTAGLWRNCRAHHLCDGHIVNRRTTSRSRPTLRLQGGLLITTEAEI